MKYKKGVLGLVSLGSAIAPIPIILACSEDTTPADIQTLKAELEKIKTTIFSSDVFLKTQINKETVFQNELIGLKEVLNVKPNIRATMSKDAGSPKIKYKLAFAKNLDKFEEFEVEFNTSIYDENRLIDLQSQISRLKITNLSGKAFYESRLENVIITPENMLEKIGVSIPIGSNDYGLVIKAQKEANSNKIDYDLRYGTSFSSPRQQSVTFESSIVDERKLNDVSTILSDVRTTSLTSQAFLALAFDKSQKLTPSELSLALGSTYSSIVMEDGLEFWVEKAQASAKVIYNFNYKFGLSVAKQFEVEFRRSLPDQQVVNDVKEALMQVKNSEFVESAFRQVNFQNKTFAEAKILLNIVSSYDIPTTQGLEVKLSKADGVDLSYEIRLPFADSSIFNVSFNHFDDNQVVQTLVATLATKTSTTIGSSLFFNNALSKVDFNDAQVVSNLGIDLTSLNLDQKITSLKVSKVSADATIKFEISAQNNPFSVTTKDVQVTSSSFDASTLTTVKIALEQIKTTTLVDFYQNALFTSGLSSSELATQLGIDVSTLGPEEFTVVISKSSESSVVGYELNFGLWSSPVNFNVTFLSSTGDIGVLNEIKSKLQALTRTEFHQPFFENISIGSTTNMVNFNVIEMGLGSSDPDVLAIQVLITHGVKLQAYKLSNSSTLNFALTKEGNLAPSLSFQVTITSFDQGTSITQAELDYDHYRMMIAILTDSPSFEIIADLAEVKDGNFTAAKANSLGITNFIPNASYTYTYSHDAIDARGGNFRVMIITKYNNLQTSLNLRLPISVLAKGTDYQLLKFHASAIASSVQTSLTEAAFLALTLNDNDFATAKDLLGISVALNLLSDESISVSKAANSADVFYTYTKYKTIFVEKVSFSQYAT